MADDAQNESVGASGRREALLHADSQMWRVRWLCVVFTVAQFLLYRPPAGVEVPFPRVPMAALVASIVIATNLLSLIARKASDLRVAARIGSLQLALDAVVVTGVVWLFSFDGNSALWALLVLVVIEGAMREQLRGAMITFAGLALGYVGREIWAPTRYSYIHLRIDSITYRLGIVFIVAAATGYLAKNLQERVQAQMLSRQSSDQRAKLLHTVAATGRAMSTLDAETLKASIIDATTNLGFEVAVIALIDEQTGTYTITAQRGLPMDVSHQILDADTGLVGEVRRRRETVLVEDYKNWPYLTEDQRHLPLEAVAACPIFSGAQLEAVLVAGSKERVVITSDECESLELLATHSGAALTNAHRFTERHKLEQQLQYEAYHDALTQLPNKTLFLDRLEHCLERKSRAPSPTAVLFIDLDGFKRINDSFGHQAGDEILRAVANRLLSAKRIGDTVARWGGDEFTVLIEEPKDSESAINNAQRILQELREPFHVRGRDVVLTASVGVAVSPHATGDALEVLREADVAMFWAKERGGDRCEAYSPTMIARAEQRMDLELELRHALDNGMFTVHYQPVVSLETGHVVGLEALARWNHQTRGVLAASEFIALAEERDLIIRLGHWMLDAVCRQVGEWRSRYPEWPRIPVAINLSPKELREPDIVDRVMSSVERYGVSPEDIAFEVTERALVDPDATLDQMIRLRELGVRFVIDDFGLGYSSLSYLKQFPFTILKIDKSFVADVTRVEADQAIVRSVLALAKDLGIWVVAEGVESEEQLNYLKDLGCRFVQGYHVHRPLEPGAIESLVQPTSVSA